MALGFKGAAEVAGFDPATGIGGRQIGADGRDGVGQVTAQAGARTRGTLPAQAQVAAWVWPVRAKRRWAAAGWADFAGARARMGRPWAARVLAGPK